MVLVVAHEGLILHHDMDDEEEVDPVLVKQELHLMVVQQVRMVVLEEDMDDEEEEHGLMHIIGVV